MAFLELGEGAPRWLIEAGAAGAQRVRAKMARAVELATVVGAARVDQALGLAAITGRFADDDLPAILDHLAVHAAAGMRRPPMRHTRPSPAPAMGRPGRCGGDPMSRDAAGAARPSTNARTAANARPHPPVPGLQPVYAPGRPRRQCPHCDEPVLVADLLTVGTTR